MGQGIEIRDKIANCPSAIAVAAKTPYLQFEICNLQWLICNRLVPSCDTITVSPTSFARSRSSVTGGLIALVDALRAIRSNLPELKKLPLRNSAAAVSVGIVDGRPVLDLDYEEDFAAAVDMNVVMTGSGRFVEVQGTGEEATFSEEDLAAMLQLARTGIARLAAIQRLALGEGWPF